jgi:phospholipase D3/4
MQLLFLLLYSAQNGRSVFMFRWYGFLLCSFILTASFPAFSEPVQLNLVRTEAPGGNTESVWLDFINHAEHSIVIASFFFNSAPHSSMEKIVQALILAANRGVCVRILIDASMWRNSESSLQLLSHKNIEKRAIDFQAIAGGVMHAKYMVVDERALFLGSQNFSWKAMAENHETGMAIKAPKLAQTVLQIFNLDWEHSRTPHSSLSQTAIVSSNFVNQTHPLNTKEGSVFLAASPKKGLPINVSFELPVLLQLIEGAQKEIEVDVYEYSDLAGRGRRARWTALDDALIGAAHRGVQVKIIVSEAMLNRKAGLKGLAALRDIPNLHIKMSYLPPLKGRKKTYARVDHSKFMLVDNNITWIGTGNWEKGYFYKSRDLALIIHNGIIHEELRGDFMRLWKGSEVRDLLEKR